MKKTLICLILALITVCVSAQEYQTAIGPERPKIAVVLAGGGAKGLAHIGALKVIEEADIPIDMVVGNSMGSIVGGLYAMGYTPAQLDSIVRVTDWFSLLLDTPDYGSQLLTAKKLSEVYQLRVSLDPERRQKSTGKSGIIEGRNIHQMLSRLTIGVPDSADFNKLPIPFACNATEAITGKVYEFHGGNLVEAMRSSMAIPGVFTPVRKDSLLFVDGFVTNNYPVDVAKRMGADIVIGIDLISKVPEAERYTNLLDLMTHMIDVSSTHLYENNIAQSDVYIDVDVTEYSSASFDRVSIDTLLIRGERRARQLAPQLQQLASNLKAQYGVLPTTNQLIALHNPYMIVPGVGSRHHNDSLLERNLSLKTIRTSYLNSAVNLGARFDNDEYASLQAGVNFNLPTKHHLSVNIYSRLGQRMKGAIQLRHHIFHSHTFWGLEYLYEHNDLQYYLHGKRAATVKGNHQQSQFYISQEWNKWQGTLGLRYNWHKYSGLLVDKSISQLTPDLDKERYFSHYAQLEFNSLTSQYYPTQGSMASLNAEIITDNLFLLGSNKGSYQYDGGNLIPIFKVMWKSAFSTMNNHLSFIPHAAARVIISGDNVEPVSLNNVIGGLYPGMKVSHQLTMAGISKLELLTEDAYLNAGLTVQQRFGLQHYVIATIDGASICSHIDDVIKKDFLTWGAQIGYTYASMAGPISLTTYWSERTKEVYTMLNVGYCF